MELTKVTTEGLVAFEQVTLNEKAFQGYVDFAFKVATHADFKPGEEDAFQKSVTSYGVAGKQAYAALCTLILEASRHDASSSEVSAGLEESKWPAARITYFIGQYDTQRARIRRALSAVSTSSTHSARLLDVSWRLDYYVRSNVLERLRTPVYFISLRTQQRDGTLRDIHFTASLQELTDLLGKFRDMAKQVERVQGGAQSKTQ